MRKFMFIFLLLLSIPVDHQAQGTRLIKGSFSPKQYKLHEDKNYLSRSNLGFGEINPSLESHDSESGSNRKLMTKTLSTTSTTTTTTTTTATTSKNDKNDDQGNNKADQKPKGQSNSDRLGGKENFWVKSSALSLPETGPDHYPDILDIAGMDYSAAKRKPPIHN